MASEDIKELVELLRTDQQPRKVSFGEYARKTRNQFKPYGLAQAVRLTRPVYQNGYTVPANRIHDDDVKILNQLHRPGRYINRSVELVFFNDEGNESLDIRYRNKTPDHTIERMRNWVDFSDLCRKLLAEQTALDLRDGIVQEEKEVKRRAAFSSQATLEARARAKAAEDAKDTQ